MRHGRKLIEYTNDSVRKYQGYQHAQQMTREKQSLEETVEEER
jgi:hypothetical protein